MFDPMQHVFEGLIRILFPLQTLLLTLPTAKIHMWKKLTELAAKKYKWKSYFSVLYRKTATHIQYHENKWMSNPSSWLNWKALFPRLLFQMHFQWLFQSYPLSDLPTCICYTIHICEGFWERNRLKNGMRRKIRLVIFRRNHFCCGKVDQSHFNGHAYTHNQMEWLLMDVSSLLERHKIFRTYDKFIKISDNRTKKRTCCQDMTFNYMSYDATTKTNIAWKPLCVTHTIIPLLKQMCTHGKRSEFPSMQTEPPIFFSFNFNIEYINEIGLNVLAPLFSFSVPLLYPFKAVYIRVCMCMCLY